MAQDRILKEVTHLGSTLAELATGQIDTVLTELRGPVGDAQPRPSSGRGSGAKERVNLGTLGFNMLTLASKVGELIAQLSQYDLVRADAPTLTLRSANPITNVTFEWGKAQDYALLVENTGKDEQGLMLVARLIPVPDEAEEPAGDRRAMEAAGEGYALKVAPDVLELLAASERRRVVVKLDGLELPPGKHCLRVEVHQQDDHGRDKVLAAKVIEISVLPPPRAAAP